ncbi:MULTISPECIES: YggT family protein [Helicobacter]|uniref:Integral membrane protein YggT, involved in response to extracytoplasmic stress (Osmotic shock) n=1 Tax=Helicobacter typhlonius TaxID=76936 RepID=A0A099UIU0_9HELI|nr:MULTISPECIES: YggT family protein [Helicobacter]TLD79099.1 YggT family protein [Helicobacter typhlonius]TLD89819.1 YggT family protein [Helicobacter sp. MIT 03-1616]CUU40412.1 Integral membrane protein YggT, involved in response to extracytoplasmic stress (osmotic shock) [Helicobacter typhlonius]HCD73625.1 YggT family protein [Helicobacter sp.]
MVIGTFLQALASILSMLINLYIWVIVIAALISWVRPDPYNPIVQVLNRLTQPVYARLRRIMPTTISGIDFSPLIVAVMLKFIDLFLVQILLKYAQSVHI